MAMGCREPIDEDKVVVLCIMCPCGILQVHVCNLLCDLSCNSNVFNGSSVFNVLKSIFRMSLLHIQSTSMSHAYGSPDSRLSFNLLIHFPFSLSF
jgi:hypothetical protein